MQSKIIEKKCICWYIKRWHSYAIMRRRDDKAEAVNKDKMNSHPIIYAIMCAAWIIHVCRTGQFPYCNHSHEVWFHARDVILQLSIWEEMYTKSIKLV